MIPCANTIAESPACPTKEAMEAPARDTESSARDTEAPAKDTEAPAMDTDTLIIAKDEIDTPDKNPSQIEQVIQNIDLEVSRSTYVQEQPTEDTDDFVILSDEDLLPSIKPVSCTAIVPYGLIKKAEWRLLRYIVAQLKSLTPRLLAHAIIYYYGGSGGSLMIYLISRALQLGLL